jgi:hypothetical protein
MRGLRRRPFDGKRGTRILRSSVTNRQGRIEFSWSVIPQDLRITANQKLL